MGAGLCMILTKPDINNLLAFIQFSPEDDPDVRIIDGKGI